jgi:hypothetical protein
MSAPDTNLDKQARRHRPAIWGISIALVIAVIVAAFALTRDEPLSEDQAAPASVAPVE